MISNARDAAMLWTGGKDSSMALYEAIQEGWRVHCLVTFAPPQAEFKAHPLGFMSMQARALGLPHYVLPVTPPFESSYEQSLARLRDEMGIRCVITGDIAEVDGQPNWIGQRTRSLGMSLYAPLWGRDREVLLQQLLARGFRALISCVRIARLNETWLGREIDRPAVDELRALRKRTGLDICGEEGEYHTLVVDGPQFTHSIHIQSFSRRVAGPLAFMEIHGIELLDHAGLAGSPSPAEIGQDDFMSILS